MTALLGALVQNPLMKGFVLIFLFGGERRRSTLAGWPVFALRSVAVRAPSALSVASSDTSRVFVSGVVVVLL